MIDKGERNIMLKKWEGVSWEPFEVFWARVMKLGVTYAVVGKEIAPSTGNPHNQFYIETRQRIRISTIGNSKHLNCTVYPLRRETSEAINYIIANSEKPNPIFVEFGTRPTALPQNREQGKSQVSDKKEIHLDVIRLAREGNFDKIADCYPGIYLRSYPTLRKIYVDSGKKPVKDNIQCIRLVGASGCGKTQFLKTYFQNDGCYFYNKNPQFYERYDKEETLVIDDLDKQHRSCLNPLKVTCDTVPLLFNVKFGSMWSHVKKIILTSQYSWTQLIGKTEEGMCSDPELLEAVDRRFTSLTICGRDPKTNDLFVCFEDNPIKLFPFSLRNYLLEINFI